MRQWLYPFVPRNIFIRNNSSEWFHVSRNVLPPSTRSSFTSFVILLLQVLHQDKRLIILIRRKFFNFERSIPVESDCTKLNHIRKKIFIVQVIQRSAVDARIAPCGESTWASVLVSSPTLLYTVLCVCIICI